MRARRAAQATVRVHGCDGGQGTSLKHGLAHPTTARAPAHLQPDRARSGWQPKHTSRMRGTCTHGSEGAGRAVRPARLPDVRQAWRAAPWTGAGNRKAKADREVT